ncbi:Uncharacterised protein [Klebsiella pneumoniae]|nr:Uncharacterised protein [Klebsiella pneumoniae]
MQTMCCWQNRSQFMLMLRMTSSTIRCWRNPLLLLPVLRRPAKWLRRSLPLHKSQRRRLKLLPQRQRHPFRFQPRLNPLSRRYTALKCLPQLRPRHLLFRFSRWKMTTVRRWATGAIRQPPRRLISRRSMPLTPLPSLRRQPVWPLAPWRSLPPPIRRLCRALPPPAVMNLIRR